MHFTGAISCDFLANLLCQRLNTVYVVGGDTDPFGGDDNEQVNPHDFGYTNAS